LQVLATKPRHKAFSSGLSTAIPLATGILTWFFFAGIRMNEKEKTRFFVIEIADSLRPNKLNNEKTRS
jgi:hypothetical protein